MNQFDPQKFIEQRKSIKQTPTKTTIDTAKEKGVGLLKSTIDVLNTFAYGVGGVLSGVSPTEGIKRKILPSQALGINNAVIAMATDILLDPSTYITLGVGGGAKIATKAGAEVVLNKTGTTALRETIERVGVDAGKKEFASIIAKNPQWLDKGGLKFMGQSVIPQSAIKASIEAIKPAGKVIEKIPVVGKGIKATTEFTREVFDPWNKIKKLPMGNDFIKRFQLLTKSTRSEIVDGAEAVAKEYAGYVKQYGKEFGNDVTKYIETGVAKSPGVANAGQKIIRLQDQIAAEEIKRGLLKSTLGETAKFSAKVKPIVDKYSDDILSGQIKTSDELRSLLTKEEKKILSGKNSPAKVFEKVITTKPNVENYLRHFLTEKGREYIKKGGDFYGALPKPLRAKLQSANTRTIRASIEDINKSMRNNVGGDLFEPNAFKALAGRQAEHIKAVNIFDFIDGVKKDYGIQAVKGEKERFVNGVKYIESTSPQLKGMLLPEPIVNHIDDTVKFINGDEATNNFLNGYDKLLKFWKGTVTGYFPAFHTRNMIGGAFNNWLGKVNPSSYKISEEILDFGKGGLDKIYTSKTGESFTGKQLLDLARKNGGIGQPGMIDVFKEVDKEVGATTMKKLGNYPITMMEFVENRIRFPMFVDRVINRGWSPEDAVKDVFKYHFDYAPEGLSAFERNWLKRLFPFYTWTRNNIPLQLEQIAKQPGKYAAIGKIQDTISGEEGREEMKDLPDWMKEQLNFRIGGDNGLSMWLQLSLPMEDISKLPVDEQGIRSIVSMMSPLFKTPIELVTNKNLYFGSDIVNPELKDYPELQTTKTMNMVKNLPEPIKRFLNVKVVKKKTYVAGKPVWKEQVEMDTKKLYLIKSAFGRFYSTIEQVGGDKEGIAQKLLRGLGGIPIREVDLETQRYWDTYNKEQGERAKKSYEKSRIIE